MIAAGDIPEYDALVEKHGLSILMEPGDFSLVNGDLRLTKDGDLQLGDGTYSAMFRLVQAWRFSRPHLAQVFALHSRGPGNPACVPEMSLRPLQRA